jgi:hypothetical protein
VSRPGEVLLHVSVPRAGNTQQIGPTDATSRATAMQQPTLKALAERVLARNTGRNTGATTPQNPCNKPCNTEGGFVAEDERRHCSGCGNFYRGRCRVTGFQVIDFLPRRCADFRER